jgi:hypothetical protein
LTEPILVRQDQARDTLVIANNACQGNAKIEGLMEDLNLNGTQYNIALSVFFVPYILLGKMAKPILL